jgi:hypothetical protein
MKYLKPFKFIHCVDILKQMPKFNPFKEDRDGSETKHIFNKIGSIMGDSLSRPIDTKKAKKKMTKLKQDERMKDETMKKIENHQSNLISILDKLNKNQVKESKLARKMEMAKLYM